MIPVVATIRLRPLDGSGFGLWLPLPLLLVWLILLPFAIVLLPVFAIFCRANRLDPLRAISAAWQLLAGLRSTRVEVVHASRSIRVHLI